MRSCAVIVAFAVAILEAEAHPSLIIGQGQAKCVVFEAAIDTTIKIDYKALDIVVDKTDPDYSPAYITVSVKPSNRVFDTKHHEAPVRNHLHPTNQLLGEKEGRVKHKFEVDGEANICFRAPKLRRARGDETSSHRQYIFSYQIRLSDGLDGEDDKENPKADVDSHLSHMEKELQRIQRGMQTILREADFAKEREALFHKQTESMHSATMFWPIVQVCVLLMTGFTQASHIVQFFKSRRII